jgi:enamine deaminase RidA (YjgF/YER057c/UK114 family)
LVFENQPQQAADLLFVVDDECGDFFRQRIFSIICTGKVSTGTEGTSDEPTVSPEAAKAYAAVCAVNALAAVKSVIGDLDRITRIVKVVGFVSSDPSFTGQPGVINGASELLGQVFGDAGQHARSAVGVSVLPLDSPVEVELIAEFS